MMFDAAALPGATTSPRAPDQASRWLLPGLYVAGALIAFLRDPAVFLRPIAMWEDGTQGIDIYAPAGARLFHFYMGYVKAGPDLIYWLALRTLPLAWSPYVLAFAALAITAAIPAAMFCFLRNAWRMPWPAALAGALVVGVLPLGDWILMSNLDYSIWAIAAVLLLTLGNEVPSSRLRWIAYVGWRGLAFASNPLCLPALFVWMALALTERTMRSRAAYVLLAGVALFYLCLGVRHGQGAALSFGMIPPAAAMTLRLAVDASLLALLPGSAMLALLSEPARLIVDAAIFMSVLAFLIDTRTRATGNMRRAAWDVFVPVAGIMLLCLVCAVVRGLDKGTVWLLDAPRYTYVPRLIWCALLAGTTADLWRGRMVPRPIIVGSAGILVALMLLGRETAYRCDQPEQSQQLIAFLRHADDVRRTSKQVMRLSRIDRFGDWSIIIGPE